MYPFAEAQHLEHALQSIHATSVRRRIFRQLIESMIYEGIITPETQADGEWLCFILHGVNEQNDPVRYECRGQRRLSFNRIRLGGAPVERIEHGQAKEAMSFAQFLVETHPFHNAEPERLNRFIGEIEQTFLKDVLAREWNADAKPLATAAYDELEGLLLDGHPYHPSYKSRLGFDYRDNSLYGPEFRQPIRPVWVAAHRRWTQIATSTSIDLDAFQQHELGATTYANFRTRLTERGFDPDAYVFLPLHPWQWREQVVATLFDDLNNGDLVALGEGDDDYLPQQSIRTLSNASHPNKAYVKLALSIINTSTSRLLAPHTVQNAPVISDWLGGIVADDPFLKDELATIILREIVGIAYDRPQPPLRSQATYGITSCIWRESLTPCLKPGEQAMPWNGLTHCERDGRPMIAPWIEQYGVEAWLVRILEVSVLPIIHLLYAHGVALESHAQNMILVHRDGLPQRAAFKDFHDGVRFMPEHLAAPERQPALHATPMRHWGVNRNSYVTSTSTDDVRDFVLDAFMFINLAELALFLADHFGFAEARFWTLTNTVIQGYQQRFPHLQARFEHFDLFTPTIQVERLTNRRLFSEEHVQVHSVPNPLSVVCGKEQHA